MPISPPRWSWASFFSPPPSKPMAACPARETPIEAPAMAETQLHLLKSRRFLPLFITQFLGAVNDNLLKVSLVTLVTFFPAYSVGDGTERAVIVAIATAIFIFPYFPLSATAGQLADKFEKAALIR